MVLNIDFIKLFLKERMIRRKISDVGIEMPKLSIKHVELDSNTSNEEALELTKNFEYNHQFEKIIHLLQ